MEAIAQSSTLTSVQLRRNNLGVRAAGGLVGTMLAANGSLRELDLSSGGSGETKLHPYDLHHREHQARQDGPGFVHELCPGMARNKGQCRHPCFWRHPAAIVKNKKFDSPSLLFLV
jgi:hypothetical protein